MFLIFLVIKIRRALLFFLNYFCIFASKKATTIYMISKTYIKYIWLLNTLLRGELSLKEIETLWRNNPANEGGLSVRTFHDCRKGIKEMFGIDIECRMRGKDSVYYVANPEALDENKPAEWLLRNYSVPKDFVTFSMMKDRILLEEIPHGTSKVKPLIEAMQESREVVVGYQKHKHDSHRMTLNIQPYALKVYNGRWYLLGHFRERNAIRVIALDRILEMRLSSKHFTLPKDFKAKEYFANVVGIYVDESQPLEDVRIRVYGEKMKYVEDLPLHKSQHLAYYKDNEYADFTYKVCITPELKTLFLSFGETLEVLNPESLRQEMKDRIKASSEHYKEQK